MAIVRGCGLRVKGGTYACVPMGPGGEPLESFLICPPLAVDLDELGISPLGVHLIEREGVYHVFDVVGEQHYPNLMDFIEEARRFGVSRRCEGIDYSKITGASRLVLIHKRAIIENARDYYNVIPRTANMLPFCRKKNPGHDKRFEAGELTETCSGLWYHDVEKLDQDEPGAIDDQPYGPRTMPSFAYHAYQRPEGLTPEYAYGIFAIFPLTQFEVVDNPEDEKHQEKVKRVREAGVSVFTVEE